MIFILKNFSFDKKYLKISVYVFIVLALLIIVAKTVDNLTGVVVAIKTFLLNGKKIISPFIYGFCIAYLVNPLVCFFEKKLKSKIKSQRALRNISILITYIALFGCIFLIMKYFIPEVMTSAYNFANTLPESLASFEDNLYKFFDKIEFINSEDVVYAFNIASSYMMDYTKNIPLIISKYFNGNTITALLSSTYNIASYLINILLGIVISLYLLAGKEKFINYLKKIIYAFFADKKVTLFIHNMRRIDSIFKNFIVGKTIDSTIIGILCFIGLNILNTPFIMLISVIVGVTNMIPYFGPFIGGVPAVFIVLLTMPSKALLVAIFILILQQFDGIILGPKILGQTVGISPIWIILSITIGGAVMGPLGMFIGVPVFASIKLFFCEYVDMTYSTKYGNIDVDNLIEKEN